MEEPDMACCRFDRNMPEYDPKGDLFTVKVHHGGAFCYSPNVSYLRGDVMYFDNQHVEKLRMVDLREMTRILGYTGQLQYFYQVSGRDLNYGLIELKQDEDILGMTINEPSVAPSAVTTTSTIPITAKGKEKIGGVRGGKRGGGRTRGRARGITINEPSAGPSAVTAEPGAGSSGKCNEKTGGGRGRGRDGYRGGGRGRAIGRGGKAMISNRPLLPMWDYSNFNIPSQESVHGPSVGK